ncbi:hypothetical protein BUALT_Bualt16G0007900 [Buddleja alternifolia]|uniref:ZF-HD dimerization-type domain-containing protein n=1 Tax=Buddleja alternifolia TaxID=168488 RepID=A0AAV6W885_9LAMI|nr:hypothetical protein BUALT_Bualt16G0007900 [Buddleja alternifolia]
MELTNSTLLKTPEPEIQTPARPQPPLTNGVLKRHPPPPHHHHHPIVVTYKECLKNHAASLGGHALDGCGEFMPAPTPATPTSLKCAACGCHRNFHRREPEEPLPLLPPPLEFRPHHRHHPPPPPNNSSPDNSPSPPPISSAYYPSAPHMLFALRAPPTDMIINSPTAAAASMNGRKRFRTRFTQIQREKMLELAERLCWKMQKKDEDLINGICGEIGVEKGVFKVWMHNNKSSSSKKDHSIAISTPPPSRNGAAAAGGPFHRRDGEENIDLGNNGSSSSS